MSSFLPYGRKGGLSPAALNPLLETEREVSSSRLDQLSMRSAADEKEGNGKGAISVSPLTRQESAKLFLFFLTQAAEPL